MADTGVWALVKFIVYLCEPVLKEISVYPDSMNPDTWYRSWFDTPYYHLLYRHRNHTEAAAFIDTLVKYLGVKPPTRILDMACGRGRHSIYLASKGFNVTGIDLSDSNIAEARTNSGSNLSFFVHDMRIPFGESEYDIVLNLFTSFGYFDSEDENNAVLRTAWMALRHKGVLVIDFLNAELVRRHLVPHELITEGGVQFEVSRSISQGRLSKQIKVTDQGEVHHFEERVMALYRQDFMGMLAHTGFDVLDIFGDYHLGMFNEATSPRLIIIARKSA